MKAKKLMALLLCAVLLVTGTIMGTMAYLTSQDQVVNTFTVGKVAITLDELDVDESTANAVRDKANEYHLVPGGKYVKDPTVHVDPASESSWLFVKVENGIGPIEAPETTGDNAYTPIALQITGNGWTALEGVNNVYFRKYDKATSQTQDFVVFREFKIIGTVTGEALETYGSKNITVTAYAVQADGFNTAKEAWDATFGATTPAPTTAPTTAP